MNVIDKIKVQFHSKGYIEVPNYNISSGLLWNPDLVFSKNDYTYLILIKSNKTMPPSFLNRLSFIPDENIIPLIVFQQKISNKTEDDIQIAGISIAYFINGRLMDISVQKKLSKRDVSREIKKKLNVIDIFISSKQQIDERIYIKERINFLHQTSSYPFNPPTLIEYDKFGPERIYKEINARMKNCEWIVIILEENHSIYVRYEINRAIKTIKPENIFMFVKSTSECLSTWKRELNKIKKIDLFKFIHYTNINDLDIVFTRAVHKRMDEICKEQNVKIYIH